MADLQRPASAAELYYARGSEVEAYRPILQGDVFRGIEIPGVAGGAGLAIIVTHACSMRAGAHLRTHVQLARVEQQAHPIALERWANGYFWGMPLPKLDQLHPEISYAARFELAGRVPTDELTLDRRMACLDRRGILLLQQRIVFSLTRVAVDLDTLLEKSAPVLEEADLLEAWLERRVPGLLGVMDVAVAVNQEEERFDQLLRQERDGKTLRQRLTDPVSRAGVRREVLRALEDA